MAITELEFAKIESATREIMDLNPGIGLEEMIEAFDEIFGDNLDEEEFIQGSEFIAEIYSSFLN